MNEDITKKAVDIALSSPNEQLTFEFQGGEPLTNFSAIKNIIEYTEKNKKKKKISYTLVSNLTLLDEEMIRWIKDYNIGVSTSIDGDELLHNNNRPFISGCGTYQTTVEKMMRLKKMNIAVGAIQTTTRQSLNRSKEIIASYINLGLSDIFIRPLTPLGCAKKRWQEIGYTSEEFLSFYKEIFHYILLQNLSGNQIRENYATIILKKIMMHHSVNYMELRSPCGGTMGQIAYYPNGDIFTCDEGRMLYEMGDSTFKLGNVANTVYNDIICSKTAKALCTASVLEAQPSCCSCVYQPFCGTCPIINYALYGDILPKSVGNYKCKINKGILDFLFSFLHKKDDKIMDIFRKWCEE